MICLAYVAWQAAMFKGINRSIAAGLETTVGRALRRACKATQVYTVYTVLGVRLGRGFGAVAVGGSSLCNHASVGKPLLPATGRGTTRRVVEGHAPRT
jgi:hypothetical protein